MQVRRSGPAMLAALAGMSLTLGWASSASAVVPGENGKIAFVGRDGDEEIFTVDPDGSDLTPLTSNAVNDGAPTWSPDGRRIAFTSERDGNYEIYVMDADGSNQTRLTNVAGYDITPAWSPDGQRIAFVSNRDGDFEIYVMGADGSNPTHLTTNTAYDDQPAWSPDGAKIAFASDRAPYGADSEIYVMDADGSSQTHLTDNSRTDSDPAWSPDSQRIAFARNRAGGVLEFDIHVMGADGSNQMPVTTDHGFNRMPAWSPDGRKITFNGSRADGQRVRIINADGGAETTVPTAPAITSHADPDWQSPPIVPPQAVPPAGAPQPPASSPVSGPGPLVADRRPSSQIALKARVVSTRSGRTIAGTATDDHAIRRVTVSVVRRSVGAGKLRCRALTARGRWRSYRPAGRTCGPRFLLVARGTAKWSRQVKRRLPRGRYVITSRATDDAGQSEVGFSTRLGNRRTVRAR